MQRGAAAPTHHPAHHPTAAAAETTNTALANLMSTLLSLLAAPSDIKPTDSYPSRSAAFAAEASIPSRAPALESAASTHMLYRLSCFLHLQTVRQAIRMANGTVMQSSGAGNALLCLVDRSLDFRGAYYVPDVVHDLISLIKVAQ